MKSVMSAFPPLGTLFEAYAPVERYYRMLESSGDEPRAPLARLRAEDAFLLHLVGSMYGQARAIVDLAGAPTWGATTALWTSQDRGRRVLAPDPTMGRPDDLAWPDVLLEFVDELSPAADLDFYPPESEDAFPPDLPGLRPGDRRPVLVCFALSPEAGRDPAGLLGPIYDAQPSAVVLLLGLGRVGEDPAVETLSAWARTHGLRLAALRDLSPFLASARAAAIYPSHDAEFPQVLDRIRRLFDGNFDFLTLAHQTCTLSLAKGKVDARAKELQARCGELERALQGERAASEELRGEVSHRGRQIEGLRLQIDRECSRPILKALALQCGRRALSFGRKHRALLAPRNSQRERMAKAIMRFQRRLRGRAA